MLPESRARFHPKPNSTMATARLTGDSAPAASLDAANRVAQAPAAVRPAPMRSVSQPLIGEGANMAATYRLTTSPMVPSPLPMWCSCTGAIVITATITRLARLSTRGG